MPWAKVFEQMALVNAMTELPQQISAASIDIPHVLSEILSSSLDNQSRGISKENDCPIKADRYSAALQLRPRKAQRRPLIEPEALGDIGCRSADSSTVERRRLRRKVQRYGNISARLHIPATCTARHRFHTSWSKPSLGYRLGASPLTDTLVHCLRRTGCDAH